jgi:hypothetical protein
MKKLQLIFATICITTKLFAQDEIQHHAYKFYPMSLVGTSNKIDVSYEYKYNLGEALLFSQIRSSYIVNETDLILPNIVDGVMLSSGYQVQLGQYKYVGTHGDFLGYNFSRKDITFDFENTVKRQGYTERIDEQIQKTVHMGHLVYGHDFKMSNNFGLTFFCGLGLRYKNYKSYGQSLDVMGQAKILPYDRLVDPSVQFGLAINFTH